jgi:hypothetical protein
MIDLEWDRAPASESPSNAAAKRPVKPPPLPPMVAEGVPPRPSKSGPPPLPKPPIEVQPAWLEQAEPAVPQVILSELPSSANHVDAVRVWVGPEGDVELASKRAIPQGYVEAVLLSTAIGSGLVDRLGRSRGPAR